jgi:hypothetical protein
MILISILFIISQISHGKYNSGNDSRNGNEDMTKVKSRKKPLWLEKEKTVW